MSHEPNRTETHPHERNQSGSTQSRGVESQMIAKAREEGGRLTMVRLKLSR